MLFRLPISRNTCDFPLWDDFAANQVEDRFWFEEKFHFLVGFLRRNFSFICHPNLALFGSNERGERALSGGTFCSGCRSLPRLSKIFLSIGPFLTSPATVDPILEESLLFPCLFFFGRHVRRPQKNFLTLAVPSPKLGPSPK